MNERKARCMNKPTTRVAVEEVERREEVWRSGSGGGGDERGRGGRGGSVGSMMHEPRMVS